MTLDVSTPQGYVGAMNARQIGVTVMELGGGRRKATDAIDPLVGLSEIRGIGEAVGPDAPICRVHARDDAAAQRAAARILAAVDIVEARPSTAPVIAQRVP